MTERTIDDVRDDYNLLRKVLDYEAYRIEVWVEDIEMRLQELQDKILAGHEAIMESLERMRSAARGQAQSTYAGIKFPPSE